MSKPYDLLVKVEKINRSILQPTKVQYYISILAFCFIYKYYAISTDVVLILFSENKYMSNSYFKFKQFTVYQDKCAMKVGTDGVLLGAWVGISGVNSILDIGTGTGLIALMLSQRCAHTLSIDAIDIDRNAVIQAKENVLSSGFSDISCSCVSLADYTTSTKKKYDLIVSNPPYFIDSLPSPDKQRTLARHSESLSVDDLFRLSASLLNVGGRFALIFPYQEKKILFSMAQKYGLFAVCITNVKPTVFSEYKRVLIEFSNIESFISENELVVEEDRHVYTFEFKEMLKDFYLKF